MKKMTSVRPAREPGVVRAMSVVLAGVVGARSGDVVAGRP
jgi:hypothetical protein